MCHGGAQPRHWHWQLVGLLLHSESILKIIRHLAQMLAGFRDIRSTAGLNFQPLTAWRATSPNSLWLADTTVASETEPYSFARNLIEASPPTHARSISCGY